MRAAWGGRGRNIDIPVDIEAFNYFSNSVLVNITSPCGLCWEGRVSRAAMDVKFHISPLFVREKEGRCAA